MLIDRSFSELLADDARATDPSDRRVGPRVSVEVDILIGVAGHMMRGISSNVSSGGLCVWTYRTLSPGAHVCVSFRLPNGAVFAAAIVRWVQEGRPGRLPRMGIEFTEIHLDDSARLKCFCGARPLSYEEILDISRTR